MKIGVIGCGVIGGALLKALTQKGFEALAYDKYIPDLNSEEHCNNVCGCEIIFCCLPTLTFDRMQDLNPIQDVFWRLNDRGYKGVVALRSTVLPGVTDSLQKKYPNLKIAHNPEFLTAAKPLQDLINQPAVLIGANDQETGDLLERFWRIFDFTVPIKRGTPKETEIAKYAHNIHLAVRVAVSNDLYEVCEKAGVKYDNAMEMAHAIGQIGRGHTRVPGPDGQLGFGGMCFVKDTEALSFWCEMYGIPAETLNGAIRGNYRRRA